MTLAPHSHGSSDWMTPEPILQKVRHVLGGIDLDPASSEAANKRVMARSYLTEQDDALTQAWGAGLGHDGPVTVFLNPPGGRGLPRAFWEALVDNVRWGRVSHAIYLGFSVEQLAILQSCSVSITDYTLCILRKRLRFSLPTNEAAASPTHSNFLAYVPGTMDNTGLFAQTFADMGAIVAPWKAL